MDDSLKEPPIPAFKSVDEECKYWKELCANYKKRLIETKQEYTDFEENSRELEAELETTLEQREATIRDLKHSLNQIQSDNESLRNKISNFEAEYNGLEGNFSKLKTEHEQLREHTRLIEQKNDDLERANRVVAATVSDLEAMLNQAYEKNEFLELEVEDKESLSAKHQRVLDELRDLKQEMKVKPAPQSNTGDKSPMHSDNILNGNTPPIATQKAFNIIADSLRRIDIMAAKLKACQEIMPPPSSRTTHNAETYTSQQSRRRPSFLQSPPVNNKSASASPSLRTSLNGSLNSSKVNVANDLDETIIADHSINKKAAAV